MPKKVSMKDIAQELGVSVALVSYVLNGKFTDRINLSTADKIRHLAEKYNYKPNQIAKSLKSSKSYTIGLIVADISNLFYSEIAQHIEEKAQKMGYNVVFASVYEDAKRFQNILEVFIGKQVDGLILAVPEGAEESLSHVIASDIPFVIIDREFDIIPADKIINIDNYKASVEVVNHLFAQGYKRPCAITLTSKLKHLQNRILGFSETINLLFQEQAIIHEISEKALDNAIEKVILNAIRNDKADVLYFLTNRIAMAGLAVLSKHNIKVPETVGVVCFDEAEAYKIFKTPLTYVKQPLMEMGEAAVYKIIHAANTKGIVKFTTQLVVNDSTIIPI